LCRAKANTEAGKCRAKAKRWHSKTLKKAKKRKKKARIAMLNTRLAGKLAKCDKLAAGPLHTCDRQRAMCLGSCSVLAPKPPLPTSTGTLSSADIKRLVDAHDRVRADVGVGPMTWSAAIAGYAQRWADHLKATKRCGLVHRSQRDGTLKKPYGENLAAWSARARGILTGVDMWAAEKKFYKPGTVLDNSNTHAGHYTQMVWRTSKRIGCGLARCGNEFVLACNYSPAGNFWGKKPY
jgi:pathogenesis-related protein 1